MSPEQFMAHVREHREDALCTIPHPDGKGVLICGALASRKFVAVAEQLEQFAPALARRVDLEARRRAVEAAYADVVLRNGEELTTDSTRRILEEAARRASATLVTIEHYVPCVFFMFGGPDKFVIGPVTFTRRKLFFKEKKEALRRSIEADVAERVRHVEAEIAKGLPKERFPGEKEHRNFVRGLQAHAIRAYRQFPWVASVAIVDCNDKVSRRIAQNAVETALNVTRLVLGAYLTDKVRLGWGRGLPVKTASLSADKDGLVHVETGWSALGPVGAHNWYDGFKQSDYEVAVCGSAISALVNPSEMSELLARFVDAINWFGDAATDSEASASIVKYASAIERLLFGDYKPGRTKAFANRVDALAKAFHWKVGPVTRDAAQRTYKARSSLVHGSSSPRDPEADTLAVHAHELARLCILTATQLYPLIIKLVDSPAATAEQLETVMLDLEARGLEPLLKRAGRA